MKQVTSHRLVPLVMLLVLPSFGAEVSVAQTEGAPEAASSEDSQPKEQSDSPASEAGPIIPFLKAEQTIVSREELHRWERHVRGFRRDHNFVLTSGVSSGTWSVKSFGSLDGSFDNSGVYSRFQYSFHLQLYKGFGYVLGSSTGYHYESADRRRPFKPVPAAMFPGVLAGVVVNFNPVLRWMGTFDSYLERHNGIKERDGIDEDSEAHVTFVAYDFGTAFDLFYDLSWAIRVEARRRHLEYVRPRSPEHGESFSVNATLAKDDQWLGIGLVYHLL